MALQVFGTRKCAITRKAERFFKERDVPYHFVDLAEKGLSAGELDAVAGAIGLASLIDEGSKRFKDRGLAYMDYDPREEILGDPALLKTPIVRDGRLAAAGDDPPAWADFAKRSKG